MDKQQIIGLLNTINAGYPQFTRHMTPEERKAQLVIWYEMFKNDDPRIVGEIVKRHIALKQFPPTIAEIRTGIREMTMESPTRLFDQLVTEAKRSMKSETVEVTEDGTYKVRSLAGKAFRSLPDELKAFVKTPAGLQDFFREWRYNEDEARKRFNSEIRAIQEMTDVKKALGLPERSSAC
jgi:hypothetical protein